MSPVQDGGNHIWDNLASFFVFFFLLLQLYLEVPRIFDLRYTQKLKFAASKFEKQSHSMRQQQTATTITDVFIRPHIWF